MLKQVKVYRRKLDLNYTFMIESQLEYQSFLLFINKVNHLN